MAMRGPRSNDVRPRVVVRPVYEDFKPMFEWKQEESSDLLIVYLPGFMKEYLKVTIEGRNIVRVRGERLLAGNKWSRFQEDYQIPEHCDATGIRAKFERGILTVTMPRKNNIVPQVQAVPPTIEPKTTQQPSSPKESITKPIPQKNITSQVEKDQISNTKGSNDQEFEQRKPQNATKEEKSPPIKKEELINEPKVHHKNVANEETSPRDVIKKEELISEPKENRKEISPTIPEKRSGLEEEEKKSVEAAAKKSIAGSIENVRNLEGKSKAKNEDTSSDKDLGESKLDYYYKKVVMGSKEEKQLLVNMGVAVLVIVALGAYVYYTQG